MPTTGQTQARRALVAGAWADRDPAQVSRHLPRRLEKRPKGIPALSGPAQVRLCTRSRQRMATGNHAPPVVGAMARAWSACRWAMAQQGTVPPTASRWRWMDRSGRGFQRRSAEVPPRCGVTRGGVRRPQGMRVPRMRQAPDGGQEGGSPPTARSVINRRLFLASALPRDQGEKT